MCWKYLAEDVADRFNRTWGFAILLVLSLTMWLLSLNTQMQQEKQKPTSMDREQRYQASCWCPAQFEPSQVAYVNTLCGHAFNNLMSGVPSDPKSFNKCAAYLSDITPFEDASKLPDQNETFFSSPSNEKHTVKDQENPDERNKRFGYTRLPLSLLMLAFCLVSLNIIWTMTSSWCGINIHQTLLDAKEGQRGNEGRRFNQDLMRSLTSSPSANTGRSTFLYLSFKVLVCVALIVELGFVCSSEPPPSVTEETTPPIAAGIKSIDYSKFPLHCSFLITQMTNVHDYRVQCIFTRKDIVADDLQYKEIHQGLLIFLVVLLVILVIVNAASLIGWILKLTVWRQRVSQKQNIPLDIFLLLHMAADNAGHLVTTKLEEGINPSAQKEDMIPLTPNNESVAP